VYYLAEIWIDEMGVHAVVLCVVVATVSFCECAVIGDEAKPVVETDLHLTAADSDAGNWTANLGDIEVSRMFPD
jgi:hypothetical protein